MRLSPEERAEFKRTLIPFILLVAALAVLLAYAVHVIPPVAVRS